MRASYDGCIFKTDDGVPFAINLGADFCAEHEWGIENLRRILVCPNDVDGIKRYSSTCTVDELTPYLGAATVKGIFHLQFGDHVKWAIQRDGKFIPHSRELSIYGDKKWAAAWDDGSFGLAVDKKADPETFAFVKELQKAIERGDIALWFGGSEARNPFDRAGLVVGIPSKTPKEIDTAMVKAHVDARALKAADEATGIKTLLKEKGMSFYACSPRWVENDSDKSRTKYSVIYWLNSGGPYGWYTVEELTDWANGVSGNVIAGQHHADEADLRKRYPADYKKSDTFV